jgi:DNA-binding transcriptional MocR family regulator
MQGEYPMPSYLAMNRQQANEELRLLEARYQSFAGLKLQLNMTRGKPCSEQLDLSSGLATCLSDMDFRASDGTDCRNYGGLDGLPEARQLFAQILGTSPQDVMVINNSSLYLIYDTLVKAMLFTLPGAVKPWSKLEKVRFLCPVPGYDRHFFIFQDLDIEMLPVRMTPDGPDMDEVESLAVSDPSIKGIIAVPVYSNPDGITFSDSVCRRLAKMPAAAPDFRIIWDNAYIVHHLRPDQPENTPDMLRLCREAGNPDRVFEYASTSKITWAGAGIACVAASPANLAFFRKHMAIQTIGPDKINQLRHCRFLKDADAVRKIMSRHAEILRPKFELVLRILREELSGTGIGCWNEPHGGYFISLFVLPGTASEVVRMAKACGVEVTPAGNTYPYGRDPDDANIRLAPSLPPLDELETALRIICICVRLSALRKLQPSEGGLS